MYSSNDSLNITCKRANLGLAKSGQMREHNRIDVCVIVFSFLISVKQFASSRSKLALRISRAARKKVVIERVTIGWSACRLKKVSEEACMRLLHINISMSYKNDWYGRITSHVAGPENGVPGEGTSSIRACRVIPRFGFPEYVKFHRVRKINLCQLYVLPIPVHIPKMATSALLGRELRRWGPPQVMRLERESPTVPFSAPHFGKFFYS